MKKVITISLLLICSCVTYSQTKPAKDSLNGSENTGKDSLLLRHILTHEETLQIYSFNIQLGQQERELKQKYNGTDTLAVQMKKLEGKKDELYKTLIPNDKYQLYKQKKLLIISSGNEEIK